MAVSKQPPITPDTSSGEGLDEETTSRAEAKWKRFHPFRVVRKIFRRRVKRQGTGQGGETSKKSWSTSELQCVQDTSEKYEVPSPPYKIGLSVSHDSIFSPENSNLPGSDDLNRPQGSSLSVQHAGIKNMFKDELFSKVRARRDSEEDDDDIGLPHSPCTSPTTIDVLARGLKAKSLKCGSLSAGSLISMGSSENDEDSAVASSSGNSSRMSLLDRRTLDFEGDPELHQPIPLNHNAAHHKISVRPKRTHGLPQKRLKQQMAASRLTTLPTTLEVTEDHGKTQFKLESSEAISAVAVVSKAFLAPASVDGIVSQCLVETSVTKTASNCSQVTNAQMNKSSTINSTPESLFLNPRDIQRDQDHSLKREDVSNEIILDETAHCVGKQKEVFTEIVTESITDESEDVYTESALSPKLELPHEIIEGNLESDSSALKQAHLRVSSLIKNIEHSDSISKQGKQQSLNVGAKCDITNIVCANLKTIHCLNHTENMSAGSEEEAVSVISDVNAYSSEHCTKIAGNIGATGTFNVKSSFDKARAAVNPVVNYDTHTQGEGSCSHSPTESKLETEIRQQFQQQKAAKSQQHCPGISSSLPDEESIMSNKFVISQENDSSSNDVEDSCVIVSHQVSDVTEACNLVTVDKTFNVNIQGFHTMKTEKSQIKNSEVIWAGVPHIDGPASATVSSISNVVVSTTTSNMYSQLVNEDKVTVSVNSSPEELKTCNLKTPEMENKVIDFQLQLLTDEKKSSSNISSINDSMSNCVNKPCRPEGAKPVVKDKHLPQAKNVTSSKRVSVEIVPFNQRMKDRNYQPLLFPNKNAISDSSKVHSSAVIERNLSDRRTNVKNKETEKTNNRHSFSGSLSVEMEKCAITTEKKESGMTDKVHYPVQIRIHKSKTYEKENQLEKTKTNKEAKKSPSSKPSSEMKPCLQVSKTPNEDTLAKDVQAKWEVKVHSTALVNKDETLPIGPCDAQGVKAESFMKLSTSLHPQAEELESSLLQYSNDINEKTSPSNSVTESALFKNRENVRKSSRDVQPSEDPEPELLRVFARRSIKQKHCDKEKSDDSQVGKCKAAPPISLHRTSSRECEEMQLCTPSSNTTSTSPLKNIDSPESFKSSLKSPDLVKKKSKSFCEKEKHGPHFITPLKEVGLNRRPSLIVTRPEGSGVENLHRRQRLVSEPDIMPILPPITDNSSIRAQQNILYTESASPTYKSDCLQHGIPLSTSPNGTSSSITIDAIKGKETPDVLNSRDGSAPSWLQLAQQRRELREQRERLLIGSSTNSFLDASSKPSRSSKVWDMVNNFQKMQMT